MYEDNKTSHDHVLYLTVSLLQTAVYEDTYEKIKFKVEREEKARGKLHPHFYDRFYIPRQSHQFLVTWISLTPPSAEPVDMFADIEEPSTSALSSTVGGASSASSKLDEVSWEYKWENKDEAEVHGPFTSKQMAEWAEGG